MKVVINVTKSRIKGITMTILISKMAIAAKLVIIKIKDININDDSNNENNDTNDDYDNTDNNDNDINHKHENENTPTN